METPEMMINLESLPPEILETIVSREPGIVRRSRQVNRTLRAATEREFQKLCREPISDFELHDYLLNGPQQIALLPRLEDVERVITESFQQRRDTTIRFNIYQCINNQIGTKGEDSEIACFYQPYFVALDLSTHDRSVGTTDGWGHVSESPMIQESTVIPDRIIERSHSQELDLLTQWRILKRRFGCRTSNSVTTNDADAAKEFAREYLHQKLTDRFNHILSHVTTLLRNRQANTHFLALGLWRYWELYIFVNATLLGFWPISRGNFIDISTESRYFNLTILQEWRDYDDDDVYDGIHQMLNVLP